MGAGGSRCKRTQRVGIPDNCHSNCRLAYLEGRPPPILGQPAGRPKQAAGPSPSDHAKRMALTRPAVSLQPGDNLEHTCWVNHLWGGLCAIRRPHYGRQEHTQALKGMGSVGPVPGVIPCPKRPPQVPQRHSAMVMLTAIAMC